MQKLISPFLCFILLCNSLCTYVQADEASRNAYLELAKNFPRLIQPQGDFTKGEIQIILDPQEMAAIEKATSREVGLIKMDKYWLWVNDACIFPNGKKGVYGRILCVKGLEASPGVAVMPMTCNGKVIVNCNYRHATRTWEIELPRGGIDAGEEAEAAAIRETLEETGMLVSELFLLGEIPPDTGLTGTIVPIYLAKVIGKADSEHEDGEAIEEILSLSIPEIKQAFLKGYYEYTLRGVNTRIFFRDPFLAYAIMMYELKQSVK